MIAYTVLVLAAVGVLAGVVELWRDARWRDARRRNWRERIIERACEDYRRASCGRS